ncbi:ABC transporter ATP-binding protein [Ferviditalea candida]|uniref:ABC transporter ATP-binding protein n=1 Tax=Ferviditalea candida TaxID=3108399 RepID=A0ABU5ZG38_9BACL|nr:ABC transporter ATP-binding protein [Paenibacillaceae bacterium T2]
MKTKKVLLQAKQVHRYFGSLAAVNDLSFELYEGEILGVAGPNGSGKTTLMNVITQVIPPSKGEIWFNDQPIHNLKAYEICHLGISRTFQHTTVFDSLSIVDNMIIGAVFGKNRKSDQPSREAVREILQFVGLDADEHLLAGQLKANDKKKLMIAIAIATKPKLLILDEPCAGLTTIESKEIIQLIKQINQRNITVMLIEHNMQVLMNISDRVMIIDHGTKLSEGTPEQIWNDERVIETYLGRKKKKGVHL